MKITVKNPLAEKDCCDGDLCRLNSIVRTQVRCTSTNNLCCFVCVVGRILSGLALQ